MSHVPDYWVIWEPAVGEGNLVMSMEEVYGNKVISSDINPQMMGAWKKNFFEWEPEVEYDAIITNPPFSLKYKWIERCYELGKRWALLLPVETLGTITAQRMFREHGMQIILMNTRIDFKMPYKGWDGGGAQFPVAWFTWGFNLPRDIVYDHYTKAYKAEFRLGQMK
jgi:hypothetical protein